jgi:hypothetical protein
MSTLVRTLSGVSIVTPGDWHEFDLLEGSRHRSVVQAVRRACAADAGLAVDAVQLISMLDGLIANAASAGGFYLAALAMRDVATGGIFAASVLMQLGPSMAAPTGSSPAEICAGLAGAISVDPAWAGASVEVVSLPVGPGVRVQIVAGGVLAQYIVQVRSRQLIVTFSSPCAPSMHYSDAALELFDTMAASVALVYDDE